MLGTQDIQHYAGVIVWRHNTYGESISKAARHIEKAHNIPYQELGPAEAVAKILIELNNT